MKNLKIRGNRGWIGLYGAYILYLLFLMVLPIVINEKTETSLRFFLILSLIPLSEQLRIEPFDMEWNIFCIISLIKGVTLLVLWVSLFLSQDYTAERSWILGLGTGDIYIINGIPRIQLQGNGILPMGFIIDFYKRKHVSLYSVIIAMASLAAGNSAFVLGIICAVAYSFWPKIKECIYKRSALIIPIAVVLIVLMSYFTAYSVNTLERKAGYSNAVRIEQAELLLDTNIFVGNGLGHGISFQGIYRTYNNDVYFELQTLYIFNQIGAIGLIVFYILTVFPLTKNKYMLMSYIIYLVYTFFNPYCFDSTHIMALVLITNGLSGHTKVGKRQKFALLHKG